MVKVIRDDNPHAAPATLDWSECKRYSIMGPLDRTHHIVPEDSYIARDHDADETLGYGTRDEMIALVESL